MAKKRRITIDKELTAITVQYAEALRDERIAAIAGPFCQHNPAIVSYKHGSLLCKLCQLPIDYHV